MVNSKFFRQYKRLDIVDIIGLVGCGVVNWGQKNSSIWDAPFKM